MAAATPTVVYDGSIERENDKEENELQQTLKTSMQTFQQEQSDRDAAMARKLAAQEMSEHPIENGARVVMDGAIERETDPEDIAMQQSLKK